jgi:methionine-rich copper-binding protein CopC
MTSKHQLAAIGLVIASAAAPAAFAHARLTASHPAVSSELAVAPKEIRLQFNERIEPAFSTMQLVGAKDAVLPLPKNEFDKADPKVMFVTPPSLPPGQYRVRWSVMGHDGHKVKGEFAFRVK